MLNMEEQNSYLSKNNKHQFKTPKVSLVLFLFWSPLTQYATKWGSGELSTTIRVSESEWVCFIHNLHSTVD